MGPSHPGPHASTKGRWEDCIDMWCILSRFSRVWILIQGDTLGSLNVVLAISHPTLPVLDFKSFSDFIFIIFIQALQRIIVLPWGSFHFLLQSASYLSSFFHILYSFLKKLWVAVALMVGLGPSSQLYHVIPRTPCSHCHIKRELCCSI